MGQTRSGFWLQTKAPRAAISLTQTIDLKPQTALCNCKQPVGRQRASPNKAGRPIRTDLFKYVSKEGVTACSFVND